MSSILKKLTAPTMDDTVGNLGPASPPAPIAQVLPPKPAVQAVIDKTPTSTPPRAVEPGKSADSSPTTSPRTRRPRPYEKVGTAEPLLTRAGGVDMRYLRRTNRTAMISLKVRPELIEDMKMRAYEDSITLGQLMDEMWAAHQERNGRRARRPSD